MKPAARQHPRWGRWLAGLVLVAALGAGTFLSRGEAPAQPGPAPTALSQAAPAPRPEPETGLKVSRLTASPLDVPLGGRSQLECEVTGARGDPAALRYTWVATKGRIEGQGGPRVSWVAPKTPGVYQVGVLVEDGEARARQTVTLQVHVPRPEDVRALLQDKDWQEAQRQARARQQEVEAQLTALREVVAKRQTHEDRLRGFLALEDLAALLLSEGRHEEALAAYEELLGSVLETEPKRRKYLSGKASALFALGREEEALAAFQAAGDYNQPMSFYYAGLLLEARGRSTEAMELYRKASEANPWFSDPLLRHAELLLRQGRSEAEVVELLVAASPRYGRQALLERLGTDPQLAQLNEALEASGRAGQLEEQRPIERNLPEPPQAPKPGEDSVVERVK